MVGGEPRVRPAIAALGGIVLQVAAARDDGSTEAC